MEALIPKLFILTAEASIVLFLILIVVFIFNSKAKKKDLKAVNELVSEYTGNKDERLSVLKKQLKKIAFKGNIDEQAEKLFQSEKNIVKEFVTLYLRHDTYRLLDYPENMIENNNLFLKTSGSAQAPASEQAAEETKPEPDKSEATANATIQAREQAESNEAHLKELSELRLKNTELNEHLFEALETITELMTEHGKKTGQEVDSNAQKVLEAIIYLRDKRLSQEGGSEQPIPQKDDPSKNDQTLDDSTAVNLGINEELDMDLDNLDEGEPTPEPVASEAINLEDTNMQEAEEDDPWGDALAEQATAEAQETSSEPEVPEEDPWADALEEQATSEAQETSEEPEAPEEDPWADALEEQATAEAQDASTESEAPEEDPWADALEEQATAEAQDAPKA